MSADSRPAPAGLRAFGRTLAGPTRAWGPALRRTPVSMWNDDIADYAAALTYYAILTVLPTLLVTVLVFGAVSPGTAEQIITNVTLYAPGEAGSDLHTALAGILTRHSAVWAVLATGVVSALWSACSYLAVFRRALHHMHRVPDARSPWRKAHRIVLTALALLALLVVSALVLVLSGPVAESLGSLLHLDATAAFVWRLARWPLLVFLVAVLVVVVFHTGSVPDRRRRDSVLGGALAATLWLAVSGGFTLYASLLSTYSRLYGSLAGIVVFLIWLWLSNLALLAGAQFTAELGKRRPVPAQRHTTATA
ncbi:YihY/virulence factor BrkB family protein [Streptomyces zingiberis]|uniref:YihY/virulence factor BrkB family protein n=1 Tax=Streptomyces zingiberis TaxID=2053010 RepID=A0ABX1BZ44_9ACTN|nr:YihY/virulence factor BrkB family protein [Streptomyces zingiberis]NJQ01150.1 YihY/virulence factor BrkB family protein [Streptomyces zingiberis]